MISCDTRMIFIDLGQRKFPEGMKIPVLTRLNNESIEVSVRHGDSSGGR